MAPPNCTWCASTAVAQLKVAVRWLRFIPPGLYPVCGPHLISEGIRFRLDFRWFVRVSSVPLPPIRPGDEALDEFACRVMTGIITDSADDRFPPPEHPTSDV